MRNYITRALYAAVAAGMALTTLGLAGAAAPATAATRSLSPPVYDLNRAGYISSGRWFRFVSTSLTIPPATLPVSDGNIIYNQALLIANLDARTPAPPGDTRLWKVDGTHLTTTTGTHGTLTGPWQTSKMIQTNTGTATGAVVASPSGLWNGGANFGVWLRHQ